MQKIWIVKNYIRSALYSDNITVGRIQEQITDQEKFLKYTFVVLYFAFHLVFLCNFTSKFDLLMLFVWHVLQVVDNNKFKVMFLKLGMLSGVH